MALGGVVKTSRKPERAVDDLFVNRWSPRALSGEIDKETLLSLFEAAKWAPSAYNEQPWRFVFGLEEEERKLLLECLVEANRSWAMGAPALVCIIGKTSHEYNNKPNTTWQFDCGSAWMSLTLQARLLGLYTHGMSGFGREKAKELLKIPDGFEPIAFVAIGKIGDIESLPKEIQENEKPSNRKKLNEIVFEGKFGE